MPIGAYKPAFMMAQSHVNPHEAAKAANVLRAGHVVPMHYGTFDLSRRARLGAAAPADGNGGRRHAARRAARARRGRGAALAASGNRFLSC